MTLNRLRDGVVELARQITAFPEVGESAVAMGSVGGMAAGGEMMPRGVARPEGEERCSFSTWRSRSAKD